MKIALIAWIRVYAILFASAPLLLLYLQNINFQLCLLSWQSGLEDC